MSVDNRSEKILVAEDNDLIRANICEILELHDYEAIPAENGAVAWSKMNLLKPSLIISDVNMPVMDGFELLKRIREEKKFNHVPFIFLTVRNTMKELRIGMNYGADDYLAKPFQIDQLLAVVDNKISRTLKLKPEPSERLNASTISSLEMFLGEAINTPLDKSLYYVNELVALGNKIQSPEILNICQRLREETLGTKKNVFKMVSAFKADTLGLIKAGTPFVDSTLINMTELLRATVDDFRTNSSLTIDLKLEPFELSVPKGLMEIVFIELIQNAVQFSYNSNPAEIIGQRLSPEGYELRISNIGTQFPLERKEEIGAFRTFTNDNDEQYGFGLGLHNAKYALDQLNISFKISSRHEGTTIILVFK